MLVLCCITSIVIGYYACTTNIKKTISKKTKNIIGHHQKWRCHNCNNLMLSDFRLTNIKNCTYAVCISCSKDFNLIDKKDKCLV